MAKPDNDTAIYEAEDDQSSGGAFDLPDTDGSGETDPDGDALTNNGGEGYDVRGQDYAGVKIVNGYDVDVNVTLRGTTFDDAGMAEDVEDTSATTVASGSNAFIPFSERHAYVRINVDPAADPTSGTVKAVFQSDRNGKE